MGQANHVKGRKRKHTWSVLKEPLDEAQHQVCCECCQRRVGALECADCREWFCDSCLAFRHPRECEAKRASEQMQLRPPEDDGLEEHPTACVVCGKPPDTLCADCGDVYCSNKWMGNPGCFVKMHRKGNRKRHVKRPYTYCKELEAAQEAQRRREEEEQERLAARRASVDQRVHDFLLKKQVRALARRCGCPYACPDGGGGVAGDEEAAAGGGGEGRVPEDVGGEAEARTAHLRHHGRGRAEVPQLKDPYLCLSRQLRVRVDT